MDSKWKKIKIKYIANLQTGNSINASDKDEKYSEQLDTYYPYIATKDIDVNNDNIHYDNGLYIPRNTSFKIAKKNTILLCIEGGSAGRKIGYLDRDVCFVNKLCNIEPISEVNNRFLYYTLKSYSFINQFNINTTGIIPGVSVEKLKNFFIYIPERYQQEKIVNFLDKKVSQIDSIIEKTKQSIEELIRYKHSLIIETATKGLNPNLEMKDSGIEWVGKIPKHWEVSYLNRYFREHKMKNIGLLETNLLSLSYGKIVQKDINTNGGLLPASFEGYNIIDRGDIVLRLTDLQNDKKSLRVGFVTQRGIITSAYVTLRKVNEMFSEYMYYYLHSFDLCKGFYGLGSGVRQSLNFEGLKKLKIVKPPLSEQREIVELLNNKTNQIDDLIKKKEKLVNEMESYKKSFIYEYVTGKREVL